MFERYPGTYAEKSYAVLRIGAGFLFLQHGLQKLFGVLGGQVQGGLEHGCLAAARAGGSDADKAAKSGVS